VVLCVGCYWVPPSVTGCHFLELNLGSSSGVFVAHALGSLSEGNGVEGHLVGVVREPFRGTFG